MDQIRIRELEVFARHGVLPEENRLGQKFLVDVLLYTQTREAGEADDITKSVDYARVCQSITEYMQEHTCKLIEAAAEGIAWMLLLTYERIERLELEIKKPWAPIGLPVEDVSVRIERGWHKAYIALGSNMGDKKAYLDGAIQSLTEREDCRLEAVSDWIETKPYGGVDQDDFLNGAALLRTLLPPHALLEELQRIEKEAGRERKIHWGPRTLDLDILFYDKEILEEEDLLIPHPDLQNRAFVLEPMMQISPYYRHPLTGESIREMWEKLKEKAE